MSPNPPQEGLHEHIETIAENAERDITTSPRTQDQLVEKLFHKTHHFKELYWH